MEKPVYPCYNMRITQGYNEGTHKGSYAIDDAGKDTTIEKIRAPFTGVIKKIYTQDANEVWLESLEPVEYPDGTIDYMTIMFAHANDISNLFVGKTINIKEEFYSEGTKGNATGNHCHIECGKGKFTGTGWYKNSSGYYSINNGKKPEECLWLDDNVNIINNKGYIFKNIPVTNNENSPDTANTNSTQKEDDNKENQSTSNEPGKDINLIYTCQKDGLYGIYLKSGQNVYIE